jgi:hypothetical protein
MDEVLLEEVSLEIWKKSHMHQELKQHKEDADNGNRREGIQHPCDSF